MKYTIFQILFAKGIIIRKAGPEYLFHTTLTLLTWKNCASGFRSRSPRTLASPPVAHSWGFPKYVTTKKVIMHTTFCFSRSSDLRGKGSELVKVRWKVVTECMLQVREILKYLAAGQMVTIRQIHSTLNVVRGVRKFMRNGFYHLRFWAHTIHTNCNLVRGRGKKCACCTFHPSLITCTAN